MSLFQQDPVSHFQLDFADNYVIGKFFKDLPKVDEESVLGHELIQAELAMQRNDLMSLRKAVEEASEVTVIQGLRLRSLASPAMPR